MLTKEEQYLADHPNRAIVPYVYPANVRGRNIMFPLPFPELDDITIIDNGWEQEDRDWIIDGTGDNKNMAVQTFLYQLRGYVCMYPEHGFTLRHTGQFRMAVSVFRRM